MDLHLRVATLEDLGAIAAIARDHRRRLSSFGPRWWHPADGADEIHPLWLGHLIASDAAIVRVVEADGEVVATAVALAQPFGWFMDDVAVTDEAQWSAIMAVLVAEIPQRPALTCVATRDQTETAAFLDAGCSLVSGYWISETVSGPLLGSPWTGTTPPPAPPHTFGGAFDPSADGALAFSRNGGIVIGSSSTSAPPIYDPGGTVTIVDRVIGDDLQELLRIALAHTAARGDVLLAVVAASDNRELARALEVAGFERTVDVYEWPSADDRGYAARSI